jgi:hypothetical protein
MATTTKFGFGQILGAQTPAFAHWIPKFYILFAASGTGMLAALGIPQPMIAKIAVIAAAFAPVFVLIGEMFGISLTPDPEPAPKSDPV